MTQDEFESTLRTESEKDPETLVIYFHDGSHWEYPIKRKPLPLPGFQMSIDGVQLPGEVEIRAFSSITAVVGYNDAAMTGEGEVTFDVDNASESKSYKDLIKFLKIHCPSGWVNLRIKQITTFQKQFTMRGNLKNLVKAAIYWP